MQYEQIDTMYSFPMKEYDTFEIDRATDCAQYMPTHIHQFVHRTYKTSGLIKVFNINVMLLY